MAYSIGRVSCSRFGNARASLFKDVSGPAGRYPPRRCRKELGPHSDLKKSAREQGFSSSNHVQVRSQSLRRRKTVSLTILNEKLRSDVEFSFRSFWKACWYTCHRQRSTYSQD